ncbi:MAG: DnaJ domain-containing protein [Deltaproteobacteria bacterium]|nr:DnaJ domain-containing protein [Deltaproteobacteria bacterium]
MATPEVDEVRKLIEERLEAVRDGDYFAVLGLSRETPAPLVQQAYFQLAKRIHPDTMSRHGLEDLRDVARAIFQFATEAKDVLSNVQDRARYLRGDLRPVIPGGLGERSAPKSRNNEEAGKIAFHKGSVLLTKRSYGEAERLLKQAVVGVPGSAKYWTSLGWAIFQNVDERPASERLEEARKAWERALAIDEDNAQVHYYMALYYKTAGDMERCQDELERVLYIDANHVDAQREMRLIRMRSGKQAKSRQTGPGLLSRLLTRGKKRS